MDVRIAARHGHLSEEHQIEIRAKAEKLLHYFDRLNFIEVTIDLAHASMKDVEVLTKAEHKHEFVGHAKGEDLLLTVAAAVEKAKHQVTHYKEKIQDHRRDTGMHG